MATADVLGAVLRRHWFAPVAIMLLSIEWLFVRMVDWSRDGGAEAAVLFDMTVSIPVLYLLCYRRQLPWRALALRAAALVCLGLYLASWLVPVDAQRWISELSWLRTAGLVVLAMIELRLVVMAIRLAFGGRADAASVAAQTGAPEWIARLMLLEARFWKGVWRLLRGRRGE